MNIPGNYDLVIRPSSGSLFHDGKGFVPSLPSIGINGKVISKRRHNERFDPAYVVVNGKFLQCSQKEQVILQ